MIEKCLLNLIINNPKIIEDVIKYDNVFIEPFCKKIYEKILKIYEINKTYNKDIILNNFNEDETEKFYEIYYSLAHEEDYNAYINEILTRNAKIKIYDYVNRIKNKTHIDIKKDLKDIIKNIRDIDEINIEDSKKICQELLKESEQKISLPKILSGIKIIDSFQGGYDLTDYILIAASESVGKTSYILDLITKQLDYYSIGFITCEMKRKKIYQLLCSNMSEIDSNKIDKNILDEKEKKEYHKILAKIYESKLFIDDSSRYWEDVKKKIKIMKYQKNINICYIDYLQYLRVRDYSKMYERLEIISSEIKGLAKELEIPIILIASINREGKKNETEPELYHIKGNGDIEYDIDIGIILQQTNEISETEREIKLFVKKNRNGKRGKMNIRFRTDIRKFYYEI